MLGIEMACHWRGGSAVVLAHICNRNENGRVGGTQLEVRKLRLPESWGGDECGVVVSSVIAGQAWTRCEYEVGRWLIGMSTNVVSRIRTTRRV